MKTFLLKLIASLLVGSLFFIWIIKNIDFQEFTNIQEQITFSFILLGMTFYSIAICIRSFRWQKLLSPFAKLTFLQVLKALIVGYAMNVILPARLGELFRVNICKKWYSLSRSTALATVVLERVADGITVVACLIIGAFSISSLSDQKTIKGLMLLGASLFSIAILILFVLRTISLPSVLPKKLKSLLEHFQKAIQEVPGAVLMRTIAISLLIWTFEGLAFWAIIKTIGVSLGFFQTALLIGAVSLSTLLPSPPGFLGTMQFAFGMALAAAGYSVTLGVIAASLTQIFLLGSLALTGLTLLGFVSLKKPKMDPQT